MTEPFAGRVAVVTGGASGLGRAIGFALGVAGAKVALLDIDAKRLAETTTELEQAGVVSVGFPLDVTDIVQFNAVAARIEGELGPAAILVNNAGAALIGSFEELSPADFERLIRLNLFGVVNGARAFLPQLRSTRGQMANVSSIFGLVGPPGQTAYAAAKFAVRGFSEALRHELRPAGVAVTCVYPGGVQTRIAENAWLGAEVEPERRARMAAGAERHAGTSAETAAKTVLNALRRRSGRVMIGVDAQLVDICARISPIGAGAALSRLLPTL